MEPPVAVAEGEEDVDEDESDASSVADVFFLARDEVVCGASVVEDEAISAKLALPFSLGVGDGPMLEPVLSCLVSSCRKLWARARCKAKARNKRAQRRGGALENMMAVFYRVNARSSRQILEGNNMFQCWRDFTTAGLEPRSMVMKRQAEASKGGRGGK